MFLFFYKTYCWLCFIVSNYLFFFCDWSVFNNIVSQSVASSSSIHWKSPTICARATSWLFRFWFKSFYFFKTNAFFFTSHFFTHLFTSQLFKSWVVGVTINPLYYIISVDSSPALISIELVIENLLYYIIILLYYTRYIHWWILCTPDKMIFQQLSNICTLISL